MAMFLLREAPCKVPGQQKEGSEQVLQKVQGIEFALRKSGLRFLYLTQ